MYLVKALEAAVGNVRFDKQVVWVANQVRQVEDSEMQWYWDNPTVFQVVDGPGLTGVDPGNHAIGYIDFNATAGAGDTVTIGGIVFTEADTAVAASGIWTNGASAANSAASLILAINGDERTVVPFTAYADASGDGVIVIWDAVGVPDDGVIITETSSSEMTVETPAVHGADPSEKKSLNIKHTVTTHQLLAGPITIPLPFAPTGFQLQAYTSDILLALTDEVTIEATPNRILITAAGAVHVTNGSVVYLSVWE